MKRFPETFKRRVIRYAKKNSVALASKEFSVTRATVYAWCKKNAQTKAKASASVKAETVGTPLKLVKQKSSDTQFKFNVVSILESMESQMKNLKREFKNLKS